jgi:hypothetical protein
MVMESGICVRTLAGLHVGTFSRSRSIGTEEHGSIRRALIDLENHQSVQKNMARSEER